jgi:hypothetical protein
MNFKRRPCSNCPFLKKGGIELEPGRLAGIASNLEAADRNVFHCHKTVHGPTGGDMEEDPETGESHYVASGNESACMGAIAHLYRKNKHTAISTRLAISLGMLSVDDIDASAALVVTHAN